MTSDLDIYRSAKLLVDQSARTLRLRQPCARTPCSRRATWRWRRRGAHRQGCGEMQRQEPGPGERDREVDPGDLDLQAVGQFMAGKDP